MSYALTTTIHRPFGHTLAATRASLVDQGFGILTEIDIRAALKAKLDVDIPPQVILGACRPPLAHAALQVEPSVGLLLPCTSWSEPLSTTRLSLKPSTPRSWCC